MRVRIYLEASWSVDGLRRIRFAIGLIALMAASGASFLVVS